MNDNVTIVSCFYRDLPLLLKNIGAVAKFNPGSKHQWVLINCSSNRDIKIEDESGQVRVYNSINEEIMQNYFVKKVSQSNAASMNFGLSKTDTRFVCMMDPDFFVTYPNWIAAVAKYLADGGAGALSAPYNPIWYEKAHKATGHFMFIDTDIMPKSQLTFAPSLADHYHNRPRFNFPWNVFDKIPRLKKWRQINWLYDCSSLIEEQFPYELEYLTPVYDSDNNPRIDWLDKFADKFRRPKNRIEEWELPVVRVNYVDLQNYGEFYYWRGYPFAIHMRTFGSRSLGHDEKILEDKVLDIVKRMYQGQKDIINQ